MGFFNKPHFQNPKHLVQNIAHQQPWKPQNPSQTLHGMNNVIGDENAAPSQGFSPELQAIASANAASGNVGTPGRRPGMSFDRGTGQYNPAPPPQGSYNNFGDMAQALNAGGLQAGINPRNAGRPSPYPQMQGTPGNPNLGMGSPGMRPKGDGRTNPVPNQGPKILYR